MHIAWTLREKKAEINQWRLVFIDQFGLSFLSVFMQYASVFIQIIPVIFKSGVLFIGLFSHISPMSVGMKFLLSLRNEREPMEWIDVSIENKCWTGTSELWVKNWKGISKKNCCHKVWLYTKLTCTMLTIYVWKWGQNLLGSLTGFRNTHIHIPDCKQIEKNYCKLCLPISTTGKRDI